MDANTSMPDLAAEITEYLQGERAAFKYTPNDLARSIYLDATYIALWSKASVEQWEAAIDEAIKRGLIESRNGKLGVALKTEEPKPQQMGLFE